MVLLSASREKRALLPLVLSVADFMRKKQWNKLLLLDAPLLLCKYKSTVEEKELDFEFHSAVGSAWLAQCNLRWHKGSRHISAGSGGEDTVAFKRF